MSVQEQEIKIVMRDPHELIPYENNPRYNEAAVEAVARSIEVYGFINPIVHDANDVVIAGDTRLKAALLKGLEKVPCIAAAHLAPEQVQAYRIADNKIAEIAEWDEAALKAELEMLQEIGFDIADTGFSQHEIEQLFEIADEVDTNGSDEDTFSYKEQYGVIVICQDEAEQKSVYERLHEEGYSCRVVAT